MPDAPVAPPAAPPAAAPSAPPSAPASPEVSIKPPDASRPPVEVPAPRPAEGVEPELKFEFGFEGDDAPPPVSEGEVDYSKPFDPALEELLKNSPEQLKKLTESMKSVQFF